MAHATHPARPASRAPAVLRALAGAWRYSSARREFEQLDANTLRDLGMSQSEFGSFWAETQGLAEPTRTRVTRRRREDEA